MYKIYKYYITKYRIPLIWIYDKNTQSTYYQHYVRVGSVNEKNNEKGLSHFLEHILFKGTDKRKTSKNISINVEKFGGYFNAHTTKEYTCYELNIASEYFFNTLDVILDMVFNSKLNDINEEKEIVIHELQNTLSSSSRLLHFKNYENIYQNTIYKDPVIGFKSTIHNYNKNIVANFYNQYYIPQNMFIVIYSSISPVNRIQVEKRFNTFLSKCTFNEINSFIPIVKQKELKIEDRIKIEHSDSDEQIKLIISFRTFPVYNSKNVVLDLISNYLGSGMASELFLILREKYQLTYSVDCYTTNYKDIGTFSIYLTCDNCIKKMKKCITETLKIIKAIKSLKNFDNKKLEFWKRYTKGINVLQYENPSSIIEFIADNELYGINKTLKNYYQDINDIQLDDIKDVSNEIFVENNIFITILCKNKTITTNKIIKIITHKNTL
jgi:predicted Zn-dependent peptidase